jgi:hypothetical protein
MPVPPLRSLLAIFCLATPIAAQIPDHLLATEIVDFSNAAGMGYVHRGYRVTAPQNNWITLSSGGGIRSTNGGPYLAVGSAGLPITLVHADGLPFEIISLDLGEYSTVAIPDHVDFEGTRSDGSRVNFQFIPDGVTDGDGPVNDFQPVHFPAGWSDIVSLQFLDGKVALDNIKIRGLHLDEFHSADSPNTPLEVMGVLESNPSTNTWGVMSLRDGGLMLRRQRYSYDPEYLFRFDLNSRALQYIGTKSSTSGVNPDTQENAYVLNGALIWQLGAQTVELARIGEDGVIGIGYPKPANGKVLFSNTGNENHGNPAVALAGPEGIESILTSETMLPDGGLPKSISGELFYTGTSLAVRSATTKSTMRYIVSFAHGPLLLSPGDGDSIPGTNLKISGRPVLRWLNDGGAAFQANSSGGNGEVLQVLMTPDGNWTATIRPVPAWGARIPLPGAGFVLRVQSIAVFDENTALLGYGPIECADMAPNNIYGLVAQMEDGRRHLLMRAGRQISGLGEISSFAPEALIHDGWFFATARNPQGMLVLLRGRIPNEEPRIKAGGFIPTTDGTVRFMVENLTHGHRYRVEASGNPVGPWAGVSEFTAGSPVRSVFAELERHQRGFFRVLEID